MKKPTGCRHDSGGYCFRKDCSASCVYYPVICETNADRIRRMSDDALAEYIILSPDMEFEVCRYCKYGNDVLDDRGQCLAPRGHCIAEERCEALKRWLQQPAKENAHATD